MSQSFCKPYEERERERESQSDKRRTATIVPVDVESKSVLSVDGGLLRKKAAR